MYIFKCQTQFLTFALLLLSVGAKKTDRNVPHGHLGVLPQYEPGPFDLSLEAKDEKQLSDGKSVMKQIMPKSGEGGGSGKAICVQDIEAPKEAVWNQILRLDDYSKKVPKVVKSKNYLVKKQRDGTFKVKTHQKLGVMPGYAYENFFEHTYAPKDDSLTWHLDYEKKSDFDDVAGHWHLEEHPQKPGYTRVYYACDVKMQSSVPGPVLKFISKSALRQATAWVKKESESAPNGKIPKEYGVAGVKTPQTSSSGGRFAFTKK